MDLICLKIFTPEIFLSVIILSQLFLNICVITIFKNNYPILNIENFFQCFFILLCILLLFINDEIEVYFFNFLFFHNINVFYVKILIMLTAVTALPSIKRGFMSQNLNFFEYYSIFLISLLSTLLLASTANLLSIYLVLEMQTLSFYILASFRRNSAFSTEAGLKYFVLGSLISGFFLLGISSIYGLTGTLNFNELKLILSLPFTKEVLVYYNFIQFSVFLITVVFLFKISAVPFHFWSPDVYEGSPLSSTVVFSLIPKIAIFYLFLKWLCLIDNFQEIDFLLISSGIFSIFLGSFLAVKQKRFKRLLIYSSIAQTGFLTIALSVNTLESIVSIFFFLITYILTSILIWTLFCLFFSFQDKINVFLNKSSATLFVSTLSSFLKINNIWSVSFIIIFFSLAGIPPLLGFFSKLFVISIIVDHKNFICSLMLLLVSALSVFYYLRIIKIIFFDQNITTVIDVSQIIFNDYFFVLECFLFAFFLFLISFLFFYPSNFVLGCTLCTTDFFFL